MGDWLCPSSSSGSFGYKSKQGTTLSIHLSLNWLRHIHLLRKSTLKSSWRGKREFATRMCCFRLNNDSLTFQSWVSRSDIDNIREELSLAACEVTRKRCYPVDHCPPFMGYGTSLIMCKLNVLLSLKTVDLLRSHIIWVETPIGFILFP